VLDELEAQEGLLEIGAPGDRAVATEQRGVDVLAPGCQRGDRGLAGRRERNARDHRAERYQRLGDERPRERVVGGVAAGAGDRRGVWRVGVDHGADVGAALVHRQVQPDLARTPSRRPPPCRRRRARARRARSRRAFDVDVRRGEEADAVARRDVASWLAAQPRTCSSRAMVATWARSAGAITVLPLR